jgi:hypothetical protein
VYDLGRGYSHTGSDPSGFIVVTGFRDTPDLVLEFGSSHKM